MGHRGRWVEVQIRTVRMDEIAEKGFAAHWKYKEGTADKSLDTWLREIRELLRNPDYNALEFLDDFKSNLFSKEIYGSHPRVTSRSCHRTVRHWTLPLRSTPM